MLVQRAAVAALASVLSIGALTALSSPAAADTAQGDTFHAIASTRLLDTRSGLGSHTPAGQSTFKLTVAGRGGIPADATAVVMNLTVTRSTLSGYITAYPAGLARPATSSVNFAAKQTIANLSVVRLNAGGVNIFNGSRGPVDILGDVTGYYTAPTGGTNVPGGLVAISPARLLDTRPGAPIASRAATTLQVAGRGGVPSTGVAAVVVNLTAVNATQQGYIAAYASDASQPATSSLNFTPGSPIANLAVVTLGSDGAMQLYNGSAAPVDLLADAVAYIIGPIDPSPADGTYVPINPSRVLDTRTSTGAARPAGHGTISPKVDGVLDVPSSRVGAVVVHVTATRSTAAGFVTTWNAGDRPGTSTLNFVAKQNSANLAVVPVSCDGRIALYNGSASPVDLIADVVGYYPAAHSPCWSDVSPSLPSGSTSGSLTGVSCLADTSCLAAGTRVDATGTPVYWSVKRGTDGTWGTPADLPTPPVGATRINDLSCSSASNCVAVFTDSTGAHALQYDGTNWSSTVLPQPVGVNKIVGANAVSCATDTHCVAVGNNASGVPAVWTLDAGTWTAEQLTNGSYVETLTGVSCPTTTDCDVVGGASRTGVTTHYVVFHVLSGGVWTTARPASAGTLSGVSCVTATECYAVGVNVAADTVDVNTGAPTGMWELSGQPKDTLGAVSCPAAGTCAAVGAARAALRTPATKWQPAENLYPIARSAGNLAHVSCSAATDCLAVGYSGSPGKPWVEVYA